MSCPCPVQVVLTAIVSLAQPVGLPAASNVQRVTGTVPLAVAVLRLILSSKKDAPALS